MDYQEEFKKLRRKIRINENGSIAELMQNMGIKYKLNYGVSVTKLKQLAKPYEGNNEFARFLWQKDIREARLISLMILDTSKLSPEETDTFVKDFVSGEEVEQACMHSFYKLGFALDKIADYSNETGEFAKMTAYVLLARLSQMQAEIKDSEFRKFFDKLILDSRTESVHVKKGISRALRMLARRNDKLKADVMEICKSLESSNNLSSQWIAEDVKTEIEY